MTGWYKTESKVRPELIDDQSSETTVYLRRNIELVQRRDHIGEDEIDSLEPYNMYLYEERQLTKEEYTQYLLMKEQTEEIRQIRTDEAIDSYTLQLMEEGIL